ncbi:Uncharacterised protein [Enterobacter cancerogenus]|uniref:Uncharacterized protein n=1 Tax=Enterobacter cancerogenus TaxID=69218 RepID=A0A484XH76_9ENTR|nr:Uncharacterised protein [Enterobacter cancerogenus]
MESPTSIKSRDPFINNIRRNLNSYRIVYVKIVIKYRCNICIFLRIRLFEHTDDMIHMAGAVKIRNNINVSFTGILQ